MVVKRYISRDNSGANTIVAARVSDFENTIGSADLHAPSFKKATFGFFGSIAFLYAMAFLLSAVI
jgi:hypothetical protein